MSELSIRRCSSPGLTAYSFLSTTCCSRSRYTRKASPTYLSVQMAPLLLQRREMERLSLQRLYRNVNGASVHLGPCYATIAVHAEDDCSLAARLSSRAASMMVSFQTNQTVCFGTLACTMRLRPSKTGRFGIEGEREKMIAPLPPRDPNGRHQ